MSDNTSCDALTEPLSNLIDHPAPDARVVYAVRVLLDWLMPLLDTDQPIPVIMPQQDCEAQDVSA